MRALVEAELLGLGGALLVAPLPEYAQRELVEEGLCKHWDGEPQAWKSDRVRDHIDRHSRSLAKVGWDKSVQMAGCRACTGCPNRTGAQVSLLEGETEDRCLNKTCYDTKHKAAGETKARAVAQKEGSTFLPTKDRKNMWDTFYEAGCKAWAAGRSDVSWRELVPGATVYVAPKLGYDGKVGVQRYIKKVDVLAELEETDPDTHRLLTNRVAGNDPEERERLHRERAALREDVMSWARRLSGDAAIAMLLKFALGRWSNGPADEAPLGEKLAFLVKADLPEWSHSFDDDLDWYAKFFGVDFRKHIEGGQAEGADVLEGAAE